VYAVKVLHAGRILDGACNIGYNPTFNNGKLTVEVHLLDFDGDLYGRDLRVFFIRRIRDEKPFFDVEELKQAIEKDIAVCREILGGVSLSEGRLKVEG
jgi:riboflavin kinase/FMN adenylyltransferase